MRNALFQVISQGNVRLEQPKKQMLGGCKNGNGLFYDRRKAHAWIRVGKVPIVEEHTGTSRPTGGDRLSEEKRTISEDEVAAKLEQARKNSKRDLSGKWIVRGTE